ncbi:MAG TPA: hypothetical protein VNK52_15455 [Hyphomicrobiaceae bacterium]|nr:hypothetical protein [Hyphomicrobiaceae bacterium]
MKSRCGAVLLLTLAVPAAAEAGTLPAVKSGPGNEVPACVTPGRLLDYLKDRNPSLEPRFREVPVAYMRHGEELNVRWDYAFFQMVVETGSLSFQRTKGRAGDVSASQNNFAGLGATGGVPGESFPDISSGVKAHLQHLLMYAGDTITDPVAERTRKVQEWGVLTSWQKTFKGPITYTDLARKWAPGSNAYAAMLEQVGKRFYDDFCSRPDPEPQLVAEARKWRSDAVTVASPAEPTDSGPPERVSGADLARQAVERARREGETARSSLGFSPSAASASPAEQSPFQSLLAVVMPKSGGEALAAQPPAASVQTVSVAGTRPAAAPPKATPALKCRVWTASYGGLKSVIIRSVADQQVNYTVLDVNEGTETREVEAYVAAYAKGGQKVAEFRNQSQALERAFELCPEG